MTTTPTGAIRNISGDDRLVAWLGDRLVLDGQSIDVPLDQVTAYTQQESTWEAADAAAEAVHAEMLEALAFLAEPIVADPPDDVVASNLAADLIAAVKLVDDPARLGELLAAEHDRDQVRKTVVAAIEKQIAALDAEPVGVQVPGALVESDIAGTGDAVNAETGEVTPAGDPLPTIEQSDGTPLDPPEGPSATPSNDDTTMEG